MARYTPKRITWKSAPHVAQEEELKLPPLPREVGDDLYSAEVAASLHVGDLFIATKHLEAPPYPKWVKPHPLRYVQETWTDQGWAGSASKIFKSGSLAIYAGTARVSEVDHKARTVSRLRHTFIIEGCQYMTLNLNIFRKVV